MMVLHQNKYRELCNRENLTIGEYVNGLYDIVADKVFEKIWQSLETIKFTNLTKEEIREKIEDEIISYANRLYENCTIKNYNISKIAQRMITETIKRLDTLNKKKIKTINETIDIVERYNTIKDIAADNNENDSQARLINALIEKYTQIVLVKKKKKVYKYKRNVTPYQNDVLRWILEGKSLIEISKGIGVTNSCVGQTYRIAITNIAKDYDELMLYYGGDYEEIINRLYKSYELFQMNEKGLNI